jgi:uncharacterized membrane protein (UPF0127 family)
LTRSLLAVSIATSVASLLPACKSGEGQGGAAAAPAPVAPTATVDTGERRIAFRLELARTPAERERGLMYRDYLAPDAGMLFVFDREEPQVFWMKNTVIPLDMIFIGGDRRIVGIVADAEPQTLSPRRVNGLSQFVLEIGGGLSAKLGLRAGQTVALRGVPTPQP